MKISPINNIQNNKKQNFKAKFSKRDVQEFIREATTNNIIDEIPQLYTMLDFIKKLPGEKAEIKHIGLWHKILIDGKSLSNNKKYFCAIHALQDSTVEQKSTLIKESSIKRMSEDEFVDTYYKNNKKNIRDIENLFEA